MRKSINTFSWDSSYALRERCKVWSSYTGITFYVKFVTAIECELWSLSKGRVVKMLLSKREPALVRAVVEWEIAKAEGQLRSAA